MVPAGPTSAKAPTPHATRRSTPIRLSLNLTKRSMARVARVVGTWVAVLTFTGWVLFPYGWMLLTSIKPAQELYTKEVVYWPKTPTIEGYRLLVTSTPFPVYLKNSLVVALATCIVAMVVALMAAYALSRFRFRGKDGVIFSFLLSQMFPSVLLVLPLFLTMRVLRLLNTPWALIVAHSTFAVPFTTWMLTGFLNAIPKELDQAAMIDGANRFQVFRHILLPLAAPGIAASLTYVFIFSWNEFLYALTFTSDVSTRTLPIGLHSFMGEYIIRWDLLTAGGVLTALPIVFIFMLVQRYLIAGLTAGSVKG